MEKAKKYFIRSAGKGEMKIYHLINLIDFSQLDIFFNSIEEIVAGFPRLDKGTSTCVQTPRVVGRVKV